MKTSNLTILELSTVQRPYKMARRLQRCVYVRLKNVYLWQVLRSRGICNAGSLSILGHLILPKKLINLYFTVAQLYSLPCSIICLRKNVTSLHIIKIRNMFQKSQIPHLLPAAAVRRFGIFQYFHSS